MATAEMVMTATTRGRCALRCADRPIPQAHVPRTASGRAIATTAARPLTLILVCQSVLSVRLSVCLSVCPCVCLSVRLSAAASTTMVAGAAQAGGGAGGRRALASGAMLGGGARRRWRCLRCCGKRRLACWLLNWFVRLSDHLFVHLFVHQCIHLCIHLFFRPFLRLTGSLSVCLSVRPFVSPSNAARPHVRGCGYVHLLLAPLYNKFTV